VKVADLELRPATLDDAPFAADMHTALRPDDPDDPVLMRHWWTVEATDNVVERWIAMHDGRPVGLAFQRHAPVGEDAGTLRPRRGRRASRTPHARASGRALRAR
jgi:hypothetical protein